jgi:arginine deiminase
MRKATIKVGVKAEYLPAKTIIMHTPEDELFWGALQPSAALWEPKKIDIYKVTEQHKNYINLLEKNGVNVLTVKEILLEGVLDSNNKPVQGKELDDLVTLAASSVNYVYDKDIPQEKISEMQALQEEMIQYLKPGDLVNKIILEPREIRIKKCYEGNTDVISEYVSHPIMNLHFLRDQQITTDKGVVISKMNSTQRKAETEITKFAFKKIGLEPIYEVQGNGRLEGGDFIPCGDYAFIGQGLRTNEEGIKQLFENNVFGYKEVAVVKDAYKQQDEMHLDTYFNIAGANRAVILEDRVDHYNENGELVKADQKKKTLVDIYKMEGDKYALEEKDKPFQDYLANKGFSIDKGSLVTLTKGEQLNYGVNFLTISDNKVVAVQGVSKNYMPKMNKAGISVIEIELDEFVKTYGAPHCATQVTCRAL